MGKTQSMGVSLKHFLGGQEKPSPVKPKQKRMKVRGEDFRAAQQDPDVQEFLRKALVEEERLEREGLIHP
jgi:hypothetical protein